MSFNDDKVISFTFEHKNQPDFPATIYTTLQFKNLLDTQAEQPQAGLNALIDSLQISTAGISASEQLGSAPITGVTGSTVYAQLAFMEDQIQDIVGASIPPGTITTAMIQDGAVTYVKLNPAPVSAATANTLVLRDVNGKFLVPTPTLATDITTKTYVDTAVNVANTYYTVSDDVIVSLPAVKSGASGSGLKYFYTKNAGKYRIKGEYRTLSAPTQAGIGIRITLGNDAGGSTDNSVITQTTSGSFVTFSLDLPFIPENCRINAFSFGSASVQIQNVTLCGTTIIGNQNTFSGSDF